MARHLSLDDRSAICNGLDRGGFLQTDWKGAGKGLHDHLQGGEGPYGLPEDGRHGESL